MRILKLTSAIEKKLLARANFADAEAERVAAKIVADIRKRGDSALFAWTERLDHCFAQRKDALDLTNRNLAAEKKVQLRLLAAPSAKRRATSAA